MGKKLKASWVTLNPLLRLLFFKGFLSIVVSCGGGGDDNPPNQVVEDPSYEVYGSFTDPAIVNYEYPSKINFFTLISEATGSKLIDQEYPYYIIYNRSDDVVSIEKILKRDGTVWLERTDLGPGEKWVLENDGSITTFCINIHGDVTLAPLGCVEPVDKQQGQDVSIEPQGPPVEDPPAEDPPVAIFTASPISGNAPLEVNFNASDSFDPDGTIVKYAWDFDDYSNVVFPIDIWEQSTPESQGVDSVKLEQALNYIKDHTGNDGIKEVVVVRNGYVIWKGENTNKSHDIWSVTKVFTSSVLGLLVDEGTVTVNSRARKFDPDLTDLYTQVTLHHFATFTSGYDAEGYSDWGKDPSDSFGDGSNNPWIHTFPLFSHGSAFAYWDDAANMEAHVLTRISREPIYDLFKRRIGDIIGMNTDNWGWKNFGIVDEITLNGGAGSNNAGVYTSALELAKLGHLYLNRGKWDGTEILSAAWIERATQNQVSRFIPLADTKGTYLDGRGIYGYHWWTNDIKPDSNRNMPDAPIGTYYVTGHNDNFLVIVPEWNLVFVRLGLDETIPANEHSVYLNEFLKILGEGITSANSIGEEVSHTYTTPGSYIVSLSVTDDDSTTNVTNQTITVTLH